MPPTPLHQVGLVAGKWYIIELKDGSAVEGTFKGFDTDREGIWVDSDEAVGQIFIDDIDIKAIHTTFGTITVAEE